MKRSNFATFQIQPIESKKETHPACGPSSTGRSLLEKTTGASARRRGAAFRKVHQLGQIPTLVNSHIAMERSTIFHGKIHYKSPFFMGKSTISMAMFNSFLMLFVCSPGRVSTLGHWLLDSNTHIFIFGSIPSPSGQGGRNDATQKRSDVVMKGPFLETGA